MAKIPLTGECPKCGHNGGYQLRWCMGAPAQGSLALLHRQGRQTLGGCEREGEHVHRICSTCFYDSPVDPVDLEQKIVGRHEGREIEAAMLDLYFDPNVVPGEPVERCTHDHHHAARHAARSLPGFACWRFDGWPGDHPHFNRDVYPDRAALWKLQCDRRRGESATYQPLGGGPLRDWSVQDRAKADIESGTR